MRDLRVVRVVAACGLLLGLAVVLGPSAAPPPALAAEVKHTIVTDAMLLNAAKDAKNWVHYGRDYTNQRYSPLSQISTRNVGSLIPRWVFQTGVIGSFQTVPIVVDGVMYLTTPYNHAIAVDASTGRELWRHQHKLGTQIFCCGPNNRGVAVAYGKVYMATLDARLVALDQHTGKVIWDIEIADPEFGHSETMAPLAYKGKIIVGISGAEYGIRGFVTAYDANTGKQQWRWHTIPETGWEGTFAKTTPEGDNLNRDIEAEKVAMAQHGDAWKRGGGSMWMTPALDPDLGLLYMAIGNPSPDLDGGIRPGDNLYTESIVAVEVETGKLRWHYQQVPHDVWDLDAVSPPVLFDVTVGGKKVKAVGEAGKTGWVYILDRESGKRILRSQAFVPQENMFAQPTAAGTRMLPGANGGAEWSPMAYSPQTQAVYVLGLHQPMHYKVTSVPWEKGKLWLGSAFVNIPGEAQWGTFTAIDVNTGKITWQQKTEQPLIGGALATGGGLVFFGEGNGNFNALDAKTGKVLWQFQTGAGVNAPPMTYELGGEQFIAVASGGNFQLGFPYGNSLFVFGLPKRK